MKEITEAKRAELAKFAKPGPELAKLIYIGMIETRNYLALDEIIDLFPDLPIDWLSELPVNGKSKQLIIKHLDKFGDSSMLAFCKSVDTDFLSQLLDKLNNPIYCRVVIGNLWLKGKHKEASIIAKQHDIDLPEIKNKLKSVKPAKIRITQPPTEPAIPIADQKVDGLESAEFDDVPLADLGEWVKHNDLDFDCSEVSIRRLRWLVSNGHCGPHLANCSRPRCILAIIQAEAV